MKYGTYKNDPRTITAKYDGVCKETGRKIRKGEECVYYPIGKALYCMESKQAEEFKRISFDNDVLGANY